MRDKVTRQCPQTTTSEEKGEPKRIRTDVPLLTSLTPYRWAKPTHRFGVVCGAYDLQELFTAEGPVGQCLAATSRSQAMASAVGRWAVAIREAEC